MENIALVCLDRGLMFLQLLSACAYTACCRCYSEQGNFFFILQRKIKQFFFQNPLNSMPAPEYFTKFSGKTFNCINYSS